MQMDCGDNRTRIDATTALVFGVCLLGAIQEIPTRCPNVSGTRRLGYTFWGFL
jgi:hypothetical protein